MFTLPMRPLTAIAAFAAFASPTLVQSAGVNFYQPCEIVHLTAEQLEFLDHELRVVGECNARPDEGGFEVPRRHLLEPLDIDLARRLRLGGLWPATTCSGRDEDQEAETYR